MKEDPKASILEYYATFTGQESKVGVRRLLGVWVQKARCPIL